MCYSIKVLIICELFPESYQLLECTNYTLIRPKQGCFSKAAICKEIVDCDVLISMFNVPIDREIMSLAPKLRLISNFGVGFNNIDLNYANKKGIVVCNTPDPVVEPTAELAFGLMHDLARNISFSDRLIRKNAIRWGVMENLSTTLIGKKLGIIGLGRIGKALARRALASNMEVLYFSRTRLSEKEEIRLGVRYCSFKALLVSSDFVSLHTPYTLETHHLIGKEAFSTMQNTAMLINTSRGAVVDEQELIIALQEGKIAGAALDVYENEPRVPSEFFDMDNLVLVPHIGTATREARNEMAKFACQNVISFVEGNGHLARVN